MEKKRPIHPISILKSVRQLAFLLLIPLIRGLIVAVSGGGVKDWLSGAAVDISVILVGVGIIILYWSQNKYYFNNEGMFFEKGIFVKRETFVHYNNLSTISLTSPMILKYFGVVEFRGDTHSGNNILTDFSFYINKKDSLFIRDRFLHAHNYSEELPTYRPKSSYILFLSAFLSNSAVGVIIAYTFFSQGSKILNIELEERLFDTVSKVLSIVAKGVPPALAIIGIFIVIGWVVAFLRLVFRYSKFCITRMSEAIWISGGIFTKTNDLLLVKDINYLDIRQSILTKIFRLAITYIFCTGYGKNADSAPIFIPAASKKETQSIIKKYLKEFKISRVSVGPAHWFAITSFIVFPSVIIIIITLITLILYILLVKWSSIILFVGTLFSFPFIWMLLIKIFDYITTGIGANSSTFTLYYSTNFSLHTVLIPVEKISKVSLRQKNWQKKHGLCDVILHSYSEGEKSHIVRSVSRKKVTSLLKDNMDFLDFDFLNSF